ANASSFVPPSSRTVERSDQSTNVPDGDPTSVVVVGASVLVVGASLELDVELVVTTVVVDGLDTLESDLQADWTALPHCFLHWARAGRCRPPHSDSMHALISSRHAFFPHAGGAASAGIATRSAESSTPHATIVSQRLFMGSSIVGSHAVRSTSSHQTRG